MNKVSICVVHFFPFSSGILKLFKCFTIMYNLKISSININGMNVSNIQSQLVNYIKFKRLDVIFLQEHNLRDNSNLTKELLDFCEVYINFSISHKGGTAILINRKLNYTFLSQEMSADSRITSLRIKYYGNILHFVNVYAPAGVTYTERDKFFQDDLLYYLRNNLDNVVLAGDWNCVLSERDCQSRNIHISKTLSNIVRAIKCKDAWFVKNKNVEYTYIKQNYGSRLDRIYVKSIANYIENIKISHINFSDHSSIEMSIILPNVPKMGKYYWKMNIALLVEVHFKEEFKDEWVGIKNAIGRYDSINNWWESYAKIQIKKFFI